MAVLFIILGFYPQPSPAKVFITSYSRRFLTSCPEYTSKTHFIGEASKDANREAKLGDWTGSAGANGVGKLI